MRSTGIRMAWPYDSGGRISYRLVPAKETRAVVTLAISEEFDRIYHQALMRHGMRKKRATEGANGTGSGSDEASKGPPRPIPVTTKLVNDVLQALTSLSLICVSNVADQPAWIDGETGWPVDEVLPCRNALVHLPAFVAGLPCSRSPTPRFFGGYALGYDFDRHPREPTAWLDFLRQLWPDDQESIRTLQEWMGYLLTPDTSQQKMLMMIGPKRSGKGTIARIIKALIGANNVVNPTLSGLGQRFGTEPLIGKPVAIIGDARLTGRTDIGAVVEILLTVSGEDDQTIDRKHKGAITTKLPTRFMLLSNELPRMKDPSGAIVGRMVMLKLVNSFYGQEDIYLFRKLTKELPGILAWAIHGWNRLRERGYFVQPESGMEHIRTLEDLSSPIKTFIDVCCVIGSEYTVPISELFNTWKNWCSLRGRENVGDEAEFGRNLHAAIPNLETKYPRDGARRVRTYKGITLCSKQEEYTGKENKNDLGI
jgi:putative DNA primase/helicase